jgi:regulator of sirC expression with transglutaminase-like and TPR domain
VTTVTTPRRDNPSTGAEWYAAGRRLASTSPRDALYALRRAATHGYAVAYRDIGRLEAARGDRAAAVTAYRRYLAARPSSGDAARIRKQIGRLGGN